MPRTARLAQQAQSAFQPARHNHMAGMDAADGAILFNINPDSQATVGTEHNPPDLCAGHQCDMACGQRRAQCHQIRVALGFHPA